jgi:hypothetical protein
MFTGILIGLFIGTALGMFISALFKSAGGSDEQ